MFLIIPDVMQIFPVTTSSLIDAGDPSLLDPDGSVSDIEAYEWTAGVVR